MTESQSLVERLAGEAGFYDGSLTSTHDRCAKFAELVARECAKVANECTLPAKTNLMASVGYSSKEVEISASTAERIDAIIRQRFGVGE